MARYTGATCRISRRYKKDLDFKTRDLESKCKFATPPGQHGQRRTRETGYGLQLTEKQALRMKYWMLEKPFRNLYKEAANMSGATATGTILLQLLESRLDNVVFRMGFAATRREARQLVAHKAILLNGRAVNIASCRVKVGDVVSVREKSKTQIRIQDAVKQAESRGMSAWVEVDFASLSGNFKRLPDRDELPSDINEQLIVEFYSK